VEDRISGCKDKIDIKERKEESLNKRLRAVNGICKNSVIPLKDQTCKPWALKKEKKYKPKVYILYSTK
jgi:hypothetical protein